MRALVLVLVGGLALILGPALSLSQDGLPGSGSQPGGKSGKGGKTKSGGKGGGSPGGEMKMKGKGGPPREGTERFAPGTINLPGTPSPATPGSVSPPSRGDGPDGRERNFTTPPGFAGKTGFAPGGREPTNPLAAAGIWFRRLDQDGDGVLSNEELDEALRAERALWDVNGDGFIDQGEYLEYFQARIQQWQAERDQQEGSTGGAAGSPRMGLPAPGARSSQPADGRPIVYSVDNLPRDLPSWFKEYDQDRDGQVALYEWRKHNPRLEEFQRYDQNNDGFVTAEELLRGQAWAQNRSSLVADARSFGPGRGGPGGGPGPRGAGSGPGRGGPGGGPGGGMTKGGGPPGGGGMTKGGGNRGR